MAFAVWRAWQTAIKCKLQNLRNALTNKKVIKTNRIFKRILCLFTLTSACFLFFVGNDNHEDDENDGQRCNKGGKRGA